MTPRSLRSAEFVFPAHPDKVADAIADTLVQEASRRDERALAALEVGVWRDAVFLTGMLAGTGAREIPFDAAVRSTFHSAGFRPGGRPDPEALVIRADLDLRGLTERERRQRAEACDQSITIGYANCFAETNHLPVEHWLANRLGRRLALLWKEKSDLCLGPDGKILIAVEEAGGRSGPLRFQMRVFTGSLHQEAPGNPVELHRRVREVLGEEMQRLHEGWAAIEPEIPERIRVNGAGAFDCGGTWGDNGLSGKKLVVDAYGPRIPIGGGALSGKDFFNVDRAGALHSRRLARAIAIAAGRERFETRVVLGWIPGARRARLLAAETRAPERPWEAAPAALVAAAFGADPHDPTLDELRSLSLEASGSSWTNRASLVEVTRDGHFTEPDRPWEQDAAPPLVPPPASMRGAAPGR